MFSFEKTNQQKDPMGKEAVPARGESPKRLLLALNSFLETQIGNIEVKGLENLKQIPEGKKVIIATSHVSDLDVPISVSAMGKYFDLAVVNQSTQHSIFEDWKVNIGLRIAGIKNFLPVDYIQGEKKRESRFNPENFIAMQDALEEGKTIIIAAHNPSQRGQEIEEGGLGAVYLAQLEDALILPITVNIKSEKPLGLTGKEVQTMLNRPDVEVIIGKPTEVANIEDINFIKEIFDKRKSGEKISKEELQKFRRISETLRAQSRILLEDIAKNLPKEKKGKYNLKQNPEAEA